MKMSVSVESVSKIEQRVMMSFLMLEGSSLIEIQLRLKNVYSDSVFSTQHIHKLNGGEFKADHISIVGERPVTVSKIELKNEIDAIVQCD